MTLRPWNLTIFHSKDLIHQNVQFWTRSVIHKGFYLATHLYKIYTSTGMTLTASQEMMIYDTFSCISCIWQIYYCLMCPCHCIPQGSVHFIHFLHASAMPMTSSHTYELSQSPQWTCHCSLPDFWRSSMDKTRLPPTIRLRQSSTLLHDPPPLFWPGDYPLFWPSLYLFKPHLKNIATLI